ncbi:hypothetical protein [Streptomyces tubercidicus]|uniref:hypothetical protein n=1 Tax=Streptomyces tubercidicus TaxID=47759 RepID=UPI0036AE9C42
MDSLITHQFIGPTPATRYTVDGLSSEEAYRLIGANTVAGFEPVVHTQTPQGDRLTTPDGNLLTVIALHGTQVMSTIAFEQV